MDLTHRLFLRSAEITQVGLCENHAVRFEVALDLTAGCALNVSVRLLRALPSNHRHKTSHGHPVQASLLSFSDVGQAQARASVLRLMLGLARAQNRSILTYESRVADKYSEDVEGAACKQISR